MCFDVIEMMILHKIFTKLMIQFYHIRYCSLIRSGCCELRNIQISSIFLEPTRTSYLHIELVFIYVGDM